MIDTSRCLHKELHVILYLIDIKFPSLAHLDEKGYSDPRVSEIKWLDSIVKINNNYKLFIINNLQVGVVLNTK